jgi:hypothetical protein
MVMQTIEWHENCLKNQIQHMNEKQKKVVEIYQEVNRDLEKIIQLKEQINRAITEGRKSFDNEKYNIRRQK